MKKYIFLLVFIMSSVTMSYAQYVNIPDANFRKALIKAGVDKNKDGKISTYEARRKKSLKLLERLFQLITFSNLANNRKLSVLLKNREKKNVK